MKTNAPLWHLLLPWNWLLLARQIYYVLRNALRYGNLSLDANSSRYFDDAFSRQQGEYFPEHYHKILKYLPRDRAISLCDFGCGTGEGTAFLRSQLPLARIAIADYSQVALDKTRARVPGVTAQLLDITKEPLQGTFDYILTVETLEHFSDPLAIARKLLGHVTEALLISVPYTPDAELAGPVRLYSKHKFNFNEETFASIPGSKVLEVTEYIESTKQQCIFYEIRKAPAAV